jgi:hypothetical protein
MGQCYKFRDAKFNRQVKADMASEQREYKEVMNTVTETDCDRTWIETCCTTQNKAFEADDKMNISSFNVSFKFPVAEDEIVPQEDLADQDGVAEEDAFDQDSKEQDQ